MSKYGEVESSDANQTLEVYFKLSINHRIQWDAVKGEQFFDYCGRVAAMLLAEPTLQLDNPDGLPKDFRFFPLVWDGCIHELSPTEDDEALGELLDEWAKDEGE